MNNLQLTSKADLLPLRVEVAMLPNAAELFSLERGLAVVIDTLRFTTSAITALAVGAKYVQTCTTVEQALQIRRSLGPELLLCGEREGIRIDGFDLGNSPLEYTPENVAQRPLLFSTTNGTVAVETAQRRGAQRIMLAALINRRSIAEHMLEFLNSEVTPPTEDKNRSWSAITLMCAGTDGLVTGEDVLTAGAIIDHLQVLLEQPQNQTMKNRILFSDAAVIANRYWQTLASQSVNDEDLNHGICDHFHHVRGGAKLLELNYHQDLKAAAAVDQYDYVPSCDLSSITDGIVRFTKRP